MTVVRALHTVRQYSQLGCLQAKLRADRDVFVGWEDAPVTLLEYRSRLLKLPSANHEAGSGPAHCQATFTTILHAHRDKSCQGRQQTEAACGL